MKFIVGALLFLALFMVFAAWQERESDMNAAAWDNFIVQHRCHVAERPHGFWEGGPTLWRCDTGEVFHSGE